jgi:MFS family permease
MAEHPSSPLQKIPRFWPFKRSFYGWGVVSTSVLVSFGQVPMYGPVLSVFVKPISDDMGWSRGEISLAFTLGSLGGSFASSVVGHQIDKYGARTAVVVAGMVITGALIGLALMQEVWQFWIFFGVGRTAAIVGINLGTSVAVASWFVRKRGRAVSFLGIGLRSGQATFPLMIAPIIIALSWRHAYGILAVVAFVLIILPGWLFIRRRPEDMGLLPDGERPDAAGVADSAARPLAAEEESWTLQQARRTPAFWLLIVASMTVVFAQTAINLHAVASFQDRGVADAFAGVFVFVFAGMAALSAYAWGVLMDRVHIRWGTMLATGFMAASVVAIMFADNVPMALLFAVLFGLGAGGWTVAQVIIFANYFGRGHLGAIRGVALAIAGPVGAAGPLVAGYLQTYTGDYMLSFRIFLVALVVVILALFFAVPPKHPSHTER